MREAYHLATLRRDRCDLLFRNSAMGRGDFGALGQAAARIGSALVESTVGCHIAAAVVCTALYLFVAIYWDRTTPFDFVAPYATPGVAHAGDHVKLTFRLGDVRKSCPGQFRRYFIDSKGKRTFLGVFQAVIYQPYIELDPDKRTYDKDFEIPADAADGPGLYESSPEFWCNPAQLLNPIKGAVVRIPIMVLARPPH